jgi:hypothetical protein
MKGRLSHQIEAVMRQLKLDLSELELAFDSDSEIISYYLDTETGEVFNVTEEERRTLEMIYESYYDERTQTVDWEAAFQEEHIPEWQRWFPFKQERLHQRILDWLVAQGITPANDH